jgi:hypothetical protein
MRGKRRIHYLIHMGGKASVQTAVCDLVKAQSSLPTDFTVAGVGSNLKGGTTCRAVINITTERWWMGQITVMSAGRSMWLRSMMLITWYNHGTKSTLIIVINNWLTHNSRLQHEAQKSNCFSIKLVKRLAY